MNIIEVVENIKENDKIKRNKWGNNFLKARKDPYGGLYFLMCSTETSYETSYAFKVDDLIANDWEVINGNT